MPKEGDVYTSQTADFGNSNLQVDKPKWVTLDWTSQTTTKVDLRLFYALSRDTTSWQTCDHPSSPACYSTEALKYAQTGYLFSLILTQLVVLLITRTGFKSFFQYKGNSHSHIIHFLVGAVLLVLIICIPWFNSLFGTRPLTNVKSMLLPSLPFMAIIFVYDEFRKCMIRGNESGLFAKYTWY